MSDKPVPESGDAPDDRGPFDPSHFNDPVAMQTDWTQVVASGSFPKELVAVNRSRLEIRATLRDRMFGLTSVLIGVAVPAGVFPAWLSQGERSLGDFLFLGVWSGLFLLLGIVMLYRGRKPIVFDKRKGFFWKGRRSPGEIVGSLEQARRPGAYLPPDVSRLEDIHALQLICTRLPGRRGRHGARHGSGADTYQLNLVLKNGSRVHVVDDSNGNRLRDNAQVLSRFLERPVWDATRASQARS